MLDLQYPGGGLGGSVVVVGGLVVVGALVVVTAVGLTVVVVVVLDEHLDKSSLSIWSL